MTNIYIYFYEVNRGKKYRNLMNIKINFSIAFCRCFRTFRDRYRRPYSGEEELYPCPWPPKISFFHCTPHGCAIDEDNGGGGEGRRSHVWE